MAFLRIERRWFQILLLIFGLCRATQGADLSLAERTSSELDRRYSPFSDWRSVMQIEEFRSDGAAESWWRSPDSIRSCRKVGELPLSGLHLAIDPGHLGGVYAVGEGRNFRIGERDLLIREGELVLEVAFLLREKLTALGAEVTLLREDRTPIYQPDVLAELAPLVGGAEFPDFFSAASWREAMDDLGRRYFRKVFVIGELRARSAVVNRSIRPDALLSLHINAAPWPRDESGEERLQLVERDHSHVLIFGGVTESELRRPHHLDRLRLKMGNDSGAIEEVLGAELGLAFGRKWDLPASKYSGRNAIVIDGSDGYLWARNLLLLREVDCPVVLLEPFLANSRNSYPRLQEALRLRQQEEVIPEDDILFEYAAAVVEAVLEVYGRKEDPQLEP